MSKQILDETEKYTGPRTCPNCGYEFPFRQFVRLYVMGYGLSKWNCHSCGELIKCDFIRVQIIWLIAILFTGVICGLANSYIDLGMFNILFVILYFAFALRTLYYVKFERFE
jgi:predicted RNA-binding Zn-ribbon protein involved in translation (DUF1610 family)